MRVRVVVVFVLVLLVSSCASILQTGPDPIPVNSKPPGAIVSVDGQRLGVTPCVAYVPRGGFGIIHIDKDGYAGRSISLETRINTAVWLNILTPLLVGLLIDSMAGNTSRRVGSVFVELKPVTPGDQGRAQLPSRILP